MVRKVVEKCKAITLHPKSKSGIRATFYGVTEHNTINENRRDVLLQRMAESAKDICNYNVWRGLKVEKKCAIATASNSQDHRSSNHSVVYIYIYKSLYKLKRHKLQHKFTVN